MDKSTSQVVVIGAGPTGLTLALLLARSGIASTLVEKHPQPQAHPAACILNTRTMEVFREIGVADLIMRQGQNVFERAYISWVTSLAGRDLGRYSAMPENVPQLLALSPVHAVQFPQNRLEPLLWQKVREHELIRFLPGRECLSVEQQGEAVHALLTGPEAERVSGDYLVACDGSSSTLRGAMDVEWEGRLLQDMIGVYFTADLTDLVAYRKSILYWIVNQTAFGVLIAHWLPHEWVLFVPYFPPQQTLEDFTEKRCQELVAAAVGRQPADLRIKLIRAWAVSAKLASAYRRGRVFLAGDAAHSLPPTGGLGLNTGVQDAHNLAWKLAFAIRGVSGTKLLDSYERERRPVAESNIHHSARNFDEMSDLLEVCGLHLKDLRRMQALQRSTAFRMLPFAWQGILIDRLVSKALKKTSVLATDGKRGKQARSEFSRRIPGQARHYHFLGLDLGFLYQDGAVITEAGRVPQPIDPIVDYQPTTWPGARLPHFWIRRDGMTLSIHDVIAEESMTLLVKPAAKRAWLQAAQGVSSHGRLSIRCLAIGSGPDADCEDPQRAWSNFSGTDNLGAVLVRPDRHIAWRSRALPRNPGEELDVALRQILDMRPSED
jgi:2-polyprenyl-6-methoxyphenol hydroxylase-like FAD-dependent oxidoreductase